MQGRIIKGIAGFYYVESEGITYECKARGVFRNRSEKPLVGDLVEFEVLDNQVEKGNVIKLEHNQFVTTNRNDAVELRITLEAFGTEHKKEIMDTLDKGGYRPKIVRTSL